MPSPDDGSFSDRFGFHAPDAEIVVREDAPDVVRDAVLMLGYAAGLGPGSMRDIMCEVLLRRPDLNNWSAGNIESEVQYLVADAPWYKIYDLAERLYARMRGDYSYSGKEEEFGRRLNGVFREHGIGWKMEDGCIVARGSEVFEMATKDAVSTMMASGAPTAANEIHEALRDISRRPKPDVSGAIQHGMAALECVARQYDATTDTLGPIISRLNFPKPMDEAIRKLWGFTSEQGRHLLEGRDPQFEEGELVVTVAAAVSVYLLREKARSGR